MSNPYPIACDLSAMSDKQRARHAEIRARIKPRIQDFAEHANGFTLILPGDADTVVHAAEFTTLERLCCPFLSFTLEIAGPDEALSLIVTGPEGTKEFLEMEYQLQVND